MHSDGTTVDQRASSYMINVMFPKVCIFYIFAKVLEVMLYGAKKKPKMLITCILHI